MAIIQLLPTSNGLEFQGIGVCKVSKVGNEFNLRQASVTLNWINFIDSATFQRFQKNWESQTHWAHIVDNGRGYEQDWTLAWNHDPRAIALLFILMTRACMACLCDSQDNCQIFCCSSFSKFSANILTYRDTIKLARVKDYTTCKKAKQSNVKLLMQKRVGWNSCHEDSQPTIHLCQLEF